MRDQIASFLIEISNLYPIGKEQNYDVVMKATIDYLLEYCYNKKIDFKKAKTYIFDNYKYKTFPEPSFLKDALKSGAEVVTNIEQDTSNLSFVVLVRPDGEVREYIGTKDFGKPINELKNEGRVFNFPFGSRLIEKNIVEKPDGMRVKIGG